MVKKIRRHFKNILPTNNPTSKEILFTQTSNFMLNTAQLDRISFSVLKSSKHELRIIENISFEIKIDGNWEWVVRYDDHGGTGKLHRHFRVSLKDCQEIESSAGIKRYKNKDYELTWVCNDIKRNYLIFRSKFLRNNGLNLY